MTANYSRLAQLVANKHSATAIIEDIVKDKTVNYQIPLNSIGDRKNKKLEGCTALHIVIQDLNVQAVQKLIKHGADFTIQNSSGETALHQAINRFYFPNATINIPYLKPIINLILDAHVKLNVLKNPCDKNGLSHFHAACIVNHEAAINFFLKDQHCVNQVINLNSPYVPGYTPLHFAAKYSNLEAYKILLDQYADVALRNADGLSSLHLLIQQNINITYWMEIEKISVTMNEQQVFEKNKKMIKLVLDKSQNGLLDDTELSYFHVLCTLQDVSEIERFLSSNNVDLQHSIKPGSPIWPGYTALHFAAQFSIETVKVLLKYGANMRVKDTKGQTAFDLCLKTCKVEDLHHIIESQPDWINIMMTDGTSLLELLDAMKSENSFEIFVQTVLIDACISKSSPLWAGFTPLHVAISLAERVQGNEIHLLYLERIRMLLNVGADITATNANGSTPLHTAFRLQKFKVINLLLQTNPFVFDLIDEDNISHLQVLCAAGNTNALELMLQTGGGNVNLPLSRDCKFERINEINLVSTSYFFPAGSTPLHIAVITKDIAMATLLVENGADVHAQNTKELTPIHRLLYHKYCPEVAAMGNVLFSVDNLKDVVTSFQLSHLHVACWVDHETAIKKLLNQGVDVNIFLSDVTKIASIDKSDKQLQFLLNYRFYRPINFAFCRKQTKVMNLIFQRYKDILGDPRSILSAARCTSNSNSFHIFERGHASTLKRWKDLYKVTPLHVACYQMDVEAVEELLEQGADPNAQVTSMAVFWYGLTPLHVLFEVPAKYWKEQKINAIAKLLIDHGTDVTIANSEGATAIHQVTDDFAFTKRQTLLILVESQKNFAINPGTDNQKVSHLHAACMSNAVSTVDKFLKNGANVNLTTDSMITFFGGLTPLHAAAFFRAKETVNLLLKYGANINAQDSRGNTALHFAVALEKNNFTSIFTTKNQDICKPLVMRLVSAEAEVDITNISGETPLELLLKTQQPTNDMLKLLSKKQRFVNNFNTGDGTGYIATAIKRLTTIKDINEHPVYQAVIVSPRINEIDKDGRTPIHNIVSIKKVAASTQVYIKTIKGFLRIGIDIDQRDKKGQTALHAAVTFMNPKAVAALLTLGANINLPYNGETPLSYHWKCCKKFTKARLYEKERHIIELLTKHVYALQLINFSINETDKAIQAELQKRQWQMDLKVVEQCQVELERIDTRTIGKSNIDWRNILPETGIIASFPTMKQIERQAICNVFEKQSFRFHKEFPEFAGILHMQYRKAVARRSLIEPSKTALCWLLDFTLPDICSEQILRFLTNVDIMNLIDAKENLVAQEPKRKKKVNNALLIVKKVDIRRTISHSM